MAKRNPPRTEGCGWAARWQLLVLILVIGVMFIGVTLLWQRNQAPAHAHSASAAQVPHTHDGDTVEAPHLHGIGYSADGERLYLAAHYGLRVFTGEEWLVPQIPMHDYMGYSATDDGFYSSGHPQPNTGLVNPLGLVRSTDEGKTVSILGFEGESDFHVMATGYRSHAVYVFNMAPNSGMGIGLYRTTDDGTTWEPCAFRGVTGEVIQVAVHPDQSNTVAVATTDGVYISINGGEAFIPLKTGSPVTAITFTPDGSVLYVGSHVLEKYTFSTQQFEGMVAPVLTPQDAISFTAVNPARPAEIALVTFERHIYLRRDANDEWHLILQQGKAIAPPVGAQKIGGIAQ